MTTSVTVRLTDDHLQWLRSGGRTTTVGIRDAIERAIRDDEYRQAREILRRVPLDGEDDWGNLEDFMLRARPDEG